MRVPLHDDVESAYARAHELCHVKFSTDRMLTKCKKLGIEREMQAVEDMRVNLNGQRARVSGLALPQSSHYIARLREDVERLQKAGRKAEAIEYQTLAELAYTSSGGLGMEMSPAVEGLVEKARRDLEIRTRSASFGAPLSDNRGLKIAKWLSEQFEKEREKERKEEEKKEEDRKERARIAKEGRKPGDDLPDGIKKGKGGKPPTIEKYAQWGECEIREPKRSLRHTQLKTEEIRPAESGVEPFFPDRLMTEGGWFGVRRPVVPGAAVLIDASGSMAGMLGRGNLERLVKAAPAGVIAMYSGHYDTGAVVILAKGGSRVQDKEIRSLSAGGGNVVDGPALKWLAKQKGLPKIWLCDGGVTGIGDAGFKGAREECDATLKKMRGVRVASIKGVLDELKKAGGMVCTV